MKAVVEKPITWLYSKRDGHRNRLMYSNLIEAFRQLNIEFREEPIRYGSDFAARDAPENGFRLSYHSVGDTKYVWRLKETPIPYFYSIDRYGYSGWSELNVNAALHIPGILSENPDAASIYCRDLSEWLVRENLSKYTQSQINFDLNFPFIFFPMQVQSDTVAKLNRIAPTDVLLAAARMARATKKYLVVKRHPYCRNMRIYFLLKWLNRINPYVIQTDASIAKILPKCEALIVGNSGVGLEALLHDKRVFCFGESEYKVAAVQLKVIEDLSLVFHENTDSTVVTPYQFMAYYLRNKCFDARNIEDIRLRLSEILSTTLNSTW